MWFPTGDFRETLLGTLPAESAPGGRSKRSAPPASGPATSTSPKLEPFALQSIKALHSRMNTSCMCFFDAGRNRIAPSSHAARVIFWHAKSVSKEKYASCWGDAAWLCGCGHEQGFGFGMKGPGRSRK